jgi:NAD(P)-dependent dehydrogenase (short-subunit alcohol dehydrogenase family)
MSAGYLVEPKAASERVALVTAGSAGLGAQIVRTLAPDFRVVSLQLSLRWSQRTLLTIAEVYQLHEQF